MKPERTWTRAGALRCSVCVCMERTCLVRLPKATSSAEVCWGCMKAAIGKRLQALIADRFESDPPAQDIPRFLATSWELSFAEAMEAIRLRLYVTPNEARQAGLPSWEGSIRAFARPVVWLRGSEPWLDLIINKLSE